MKQIEINMNKETFLNILNNCIKITNDKQPELVFYYYDQNLMRKIKLNSILDKNINIDNINIDNILFEDYLKKHVLWINYDKIWNKVALNYNINYNETKELIESWLKDDPNWKQYTVTL